MSLNENNITTGYEIYSKIVEEIDEAKKLIAVGNIQEMGKSAGKLESYLASLSGIAEDARSEYHNIQTRHLDDGKSAAESQARAKASESYHLYRRFSAMIDRGNSAIQTLKKWASILEQERNNADL